MEIASGVRIDLDALIVPPLVVQNTRVDEKRVARWDRANPSVEFMGQSRWETEQPPIATIPAVSLLLDGFDTDGSAIHSNRTSLKLISHTATHTDWRKATTSGPGESRPVYPGSKTASECERESNMPSRQFNPIRENK